MNNDTTAASRSSSTSAPRRTCDSAGKSHAVTTRYVLSGNAGETLRRVASNAIASMTIRHGL